MNKFWLVFRYEYLHHVLRKRFLIALISMPLVIGFVILVGILAVTMTVNHAPIGYVDTSGLLVNPRTPPETGDPLLKPVELRAFPDEAAARAALEEKAIQAYYVLAPDYRETGDARLVFNKEPEGRYQEQFTNFVRYNLISTLPESTAARISEGNQILITSSDGTRQFSEEKWFNILLPIVTGILFMVVIMTSGGYLLQAVVDEKENRTMEIIVTSVSPGQLMAGKIAGNLSVGLTQMAFWILLGVIGLMIGRSSLEVVQNLEISPDYLLLMLAILLPSFVLIAALMATIGATVTESREAQQVSGFFILPIVVPYWFMQPLMMNPNGSLSLILSYFPLTAPVAFPLRAAFTAIPPLQVASNLAVLYLAAAGSVWLAARAFRLGMLRYGKSLSLREIFARAA